MKVHPAVTNHSVRQRPAAHAGRESMSTTEQLGAHASHYVDLASEQLIRAIEQELQEKPPTVAVIGVSGVGKSSTINKLFRTNLAISDTVACTKEFWRIDVEVKPQGEDASFSIPMRIYDAPGLGEDVTADPDYLNQYKVYLSECDFVLWILAARNRAVALDQLYLRELAQFHDKMVFGLSQADLVEPQGAWGADDAEQALPSLKQEENLEAILHDRRQRIQSVLREFNPSAKVALVPFSVRREYNLSVLFNTIMEQAPKRRAFLYALARQYTYGGYAVNVVSSQTVSSGTLDMASSTPIARGNVSAWMQRVCDWMRQARAWMRQKVIVMRQQVGSGAWPNLSTLGREED